MSIADIKEKITPILRSYGIKKASIFGSFSRGEETAESDVDLLVDIGGDSKIDIYEYMELREKLEETLGRGVDLVSEGYINKFLEPYIRSELKTIYEG